MFFYEPVNTFYRMKHSFLKSALLLIAATCSLAVMAEFTTVEIDFRTSTATMTSGTATIESGSFNDATHGYHNAKVSMNVEAGNYKITVGNCSYSNADGKVVDNADESVVLDLIDANGQTITGIAARTGCYDGTNNTTSVWLVAASAQTIKILCPEYTPWLKVEQVTSVPAAVTMYTVTFVNETAGVEGTVPAQIQVAAGSSITLPLNRTLYKEGYTLTAWEGNTMFSPGTLFEPTGNTELKAAFAANASDFLTASSELTVTWAFEEGVDATPSVEWNGTAGLLVKQVTVGSASVDVKLEVDATASGSKFYNIGRGANWAQVNDNTVFRFPAKAGAVAELIANAEPTGSDLDGATHSSWASSTATFTTTKATGLSELTVKGAGYCRSLKVTYPASSGTGIDTVTGNPSPVTEKILRDGQLFIIRDGKTYNALGAEVK